MKKDKQLRFTTLKRRTKKGKLIPCPFCGSEAETGYSSFGPVSESSDWALYSVDCTGEDCHATVSSPTEAGAISKWERRTNL